MVFAGRLAAVARETTAADAAGARTVVAAVGVGQKIGDAGTVVHALVRVAGVVEELALLPSSIRRTEALVEVAVVSGVARSSDAGVGLADVERFGTVFPLVSWGNRARE